ncbi:hypothetical protein [Serratia marcescens]|uniref:hypothetical protein n=1 Tax=Serratia marcescens TaxID=615 RepID=UPI003D083E34
MVQPPFFTAHAEDIADQFVENIANVFIVDISLGKGGLAGWGSAETPGDHRGPAVGIK